jgi:glycosyltransferase involved in cell wall biosynthesis
VRVTHYYPYLLLHESGPANAILGWCRALAGHGVETNVVVDERVIHVPPPTDIECIFIKHVGRGRLRSPVRLPAVRSDDSVLVTNGGWTLANVVAGRLARRQHIPYVAMPHGAYKPQVLRRAMLRRRAWLAAVERSYLNEAAAIHLFFPAEIEDVVTLGVRSSFVVAPNGIAPPEGILWDGGSGGYLLWLGRYDPEHKGLDILLHGLRLLPETDRPRLLLHGSDWHGGRIGVERLVRELDLGDSVSVGDAVYGEAKWRLMAQAVGFIYPSRWDASPVAVGEAVSIGMPTLVADYPMGRFLSSRGGARLIDLTPLGIKAGIAWLGSPEATQCGSKGREIANRELSWEHLASSWLEQVRSLLAQQGT